MIQVLNPEEGSYVLPARERSCEEMPELIVRHFLADLSEPQRIEVDAHLVSCPRCMGRRQALAIGSGYHEERRARGLARHPMFQKDPIDRPETRIGGSQCPDLRK